MKKRILCIIMSVVLCAGIVGAVFCFTGAAAAPTTVKGDINCDGVFDYKDHDVLLKYLCGYDASSFDAFDESKCDYNGDGKVDLYDALEIDEKVVEIYSPRY